MQIANMNGTDGSTVGTSAPLTELDPVEFLKAACVRPDYARVVREYTPILEAKLQEDEAGARALEGLLARHVGRAEDRVWGQLAVLAAAFAAGAALGAYSEHKKSKASKK